MLIWDIWKQQRFIDSFGKKTLPQAAKVVQKETLWEFMG